MMVRTAALSILLICSTQARSQSISIANLPIQETVKWIEETPENPEEYIGRIFVVSKNSTVTPHFRSIPVPFSVGEEPSIKKSKLLKAKADVGVSFADIVNLKASVESVYQFQIVNTRTWSAKAKDPAYVEAIAKFRNDAATSPLFTSSEVQAVLMCVGVVHRKVWYKVFKKQELFGGGTYLVRVDGTSYVGSEDYEEVVKYGLLIRPLKGYGIDLPPAIANAKELERAVDNVSAIKEATKVLKNVGSIF